MKKLTMKLVIARTLCLAALAALVFNCAAPFASAQARRENEVKKIDPNSSSIPFAGLAAKTSKEIDEELAGKSCEELFSAAAVLRNERLNADAFQIYSWLVEAADDQDDVARALGYMAEMFRGLTPFENAANDVEEAIDGTLEKWKDSWIVKKACADAIRYLPERGEIVDGAFVPTNDGWNERTVSREEKLRIKRMRIYRDAIALFEKDVESSSVSFDSDAASLYESLKDALTRGGASEYWRLQVLTDLENEPDYEPDFYQSARNRYEGAPVDANGDPLFYRVPESFDAAKNDGERIQALRAAMMKLGDDRMRERILLERAREARELFGVQTLSQYRFFFENDEREENETDGAWSLHTLADNETIARLSTGVKRFVLPEEYDYIGLFREALEYVSEKDNVYGEIAEEYLNRRQFGKALEEWKKAKVFCEGILKEVNAELKKESNSRDLHNIPVENLTDSAIQAFPNTSFIMSWEARIDAIDDNISQLADPHIAFDAASSNVSGIDARLTLKFRNATSASFVVKRLNVDAMLEQMRDKSFWKEDEGMTSFSQRISDLLFAECMDRSDPEKKEFYKRLRPLKASWFSSREKKFIGEEVARFDVALDPSPERYVRSANVDVPKLEPGAYLIEATAKDGNKDAVVVWLRDVAIARHPCVGGFRYFALDAKTGEPLPERPIEFILVRWEWNRRNSNKLIFRRIDGKKTNAQGYVEIADRDIGDDSCECLAIVPSLDPQKPSQFAFQDSRSIYRVYRDGSRYDETRAFFVSDRPIYRPGQRAEFNFWVGRARYGEDVDEFPIRKAEYRIVSPTGEEVERKKIELDSFGRYAGSFEIPKDSKLGEYDVTIAESFNEDGIPRGFSNSGSFRLEEYRKPEFKVSVDAPKDPVALGDKFKATVDAQYYFGAPVSEGTVKYTVTRQRYFTDYYPARYWDWFYGPGYWRFNYDCEWYPGWRDWGIVYRPRFFGAGIPEVVAQGEAAIGKDGKYEIEIDTSFAKLLYPKDDQQYDVAIEVTDASRRTIVGKGKVMVSRRPFQTYVWFERGFYKVGDKMTPRFQARRVDGKPVEGKAIVRLYKIAYEQTDDKSVKPIETEVFTEELRTDANGSGSVDIVPREPGQYRVSCVVETENGLREEGGQLIVVRGPKDAAGKSDDNGDLHFNDLEIVPEKPEYAVGETAKIQIASRYKDAVVILQTRTEGGVSAEPPQIVRLKDGLATVELKIGSDDRPNIFINATTVFDGKCCDEMKEIAAPPENKILDVAVEPTKERVKPGEKAKIRLRLTDPNGEPVVGRTVVTIYDASLEYISGGSNVGDIRKFFWEWRRFSYANADVNLQDAALRNVFNCLFQDLKCDPRLRPMGAFDDESLETINLGADGPRAVGRKRRGIPVFAKSAVVDDAPMLQACMKEDDAVFEEEAPMMMEGAATAAPEAALGGAMANGFAEDKAFVDASADFGAEDPSAEEKPLVEATVRTNLADLAYWATDLQPSDDGVVEIEVDMPENLTTWKIVAWAVGEGLRVGSGESQIATSKDLIVRMQKPRFLTQKDEATLSAIVHNYLGSEKKVVVSLEFPSEEGRVAPTLLDENGRTREVVVPANGEARVDWIVRADLPGEAKILMKALTDEESDAIQDSLTIREHGIDKQIAVSGALDATDDENAVREAAFKLNVPEDRREETTKLTVRVSPTLAGAIFDAIPYLCEYPYGCTEQTLNRFLPLVLAQKALQDAGVDLETLKTKRANLNAQELGDPTERAAQWNKKGEKFNPVFDIEEARKMTAQGVERLRSMQNSDGGWGWFYGPREYSSPNLTALIVRGLYIARECDQAVDESMLARGVDWLRRYEIEETRKILRGRVWDDETKEKRENWNRYKTSADSTDAFVYFALSETGFRPCAFNGSFVDYKSGEMKAKSIEEFHSVMKEFLWEARTDLALYPLSTFALALADENGDESAKARVETILNVLAQYRGTDDEDQTAWLDLGRVSGWRYWSWFGAEFETQAYYLRLMQRVDKETLEKLGLEKDASGLVKYLLNNRKNATYWNSTRDTAICLEAFCEYLQKTNEFGAKEKVEVMLDGEKVGEVEFAPDTIFTVDGTIEIPREKLTSGEREITLRVVGSGALYYNAYLEFYSLEDPIEKAGLELKTERRYYKLVEDKEATTIVEGAGGTAIEQRVEKFERVPLKTGDELLSGDTIEVELIVDSKNDYESILLEDAKAAGFEPLEQQSGYDGNELGAYVEYRDDRVCFFATRVPKGRSTVYYRMRAETPGRFSALPTKIWAMYAPELKGNADEFKVEIDDR